MKAVRYTLDGAEPRIGRLEEERIVDAGPAGPAGFVPTAEAWQALSAADGDGVPRERARLLHPVQPEKILAIGLNYRDHAAESDLGVPDTPVVFAKWPSALIGHEETIVIPREETRPDWEGEVAIVLGRRLYRADEAQARAAVGGLSIMHDVSGRRAQLETPLRQFTLGKSFDTFAPMGPCIATRRRRRPGRSRRRDPGVGRGHAVVQHRAPDLLGGGAPGLPLARPHPGAG